MIQRDKRPKLGVGLRNNLQPRCLACKLLAIVHYSMTTMEPETYLRKHHLMTYVEDAVSLLLERKDEDSKTKPFELLTDYFKSVQDGSHILFREHSFVSATPRNRRSFIITFWQSYEQVATQHEVLGTKEYYSLLRLLCFDFPAELCQRVSTVICGHKAMGSEVSFAAFAYTFQVLFYFENYLSQLESVCRDIISGTYHSSLYPHSSATVVVPLPPVSTDASSRPSTAQRSTSTATNDVCGTDISADVFLQAALGLVQRTHERDSGQSCPSAEAVRDALSEVEKLSLNSFVLKLSRSKLVNSEISALPPKS